MCVVENSDRLTDQPKDGHQGLQGEVTLPIQRSSILQHYSLQTFNVYRFMYRVFIKYFFSEDFENIPDSGLSLFSLCVSVCTHNRQVEHQRCSRTGRVKKNHKILRKKTYIRENSRQKRPADAAFTGFFPRERSRRRVMRKLAV